MKICVGRFVLALLLIVSMAAGARAADEDPARPAAETQGPKASMARLDVQPARVDWLPNADFKSLTLTVAGPGDFYLQRELGPGQTPSLDISEQRLADGTYAYELRAVPGPLVQWGHLWVQGGSFVDKVPLSPSKSAPLSPLNNLAPPDTVIPDDLVVQGHACIGAACEDGDVSAPGSPVLRLKEGIASPLQIRFHNPDCCHPSVRNWSIQAGDFVAGHGDFTIRDVEFLPTTTPFRIGGGAPDNALTIFPVNGRIGVGTLTPAVRLHVLENLDATSMLMIENPNSGVNAVSVLRAQANGATVNFQAHGSGRTLARFGQVLGGWAEFLQVTGNGLAVGTLSTTPLILGTNSTNRLQIQPTGEVGIGTANPGAKLEVSGGEVRFPAGAGAAGFTHFNFAPDGKNYIRGTTIIADNAGSVGVGTNAPASKLHVSGGDVRVTGGSFIDDGVTLNAPDYVFESEYELMPLAELQAFIAREKHLPNVPSAREVKAQGVNLGQFQMRLLEKIEELTLYTLAQQSDLAALKGENTELRARLEALEQGPRSAAGLETP